MLPTPKTKQEEQEELAAWQQLKESHVGSTVVDDFLIVLDEGTDLIKSETEEKVADGGTDHIKSEGPNLIKSDGAVAQKAQPEGNQQPEGKKPWSFDDDDDDEEGGLFNFFLDENYVPFVFDFGDFKHHILALKTSSVRTKVSSVRTKVSLTVCNVCVD
jgi:hypothetical protein